MTKFLGNALLALREKKGQARSGSAQLSEHNRDLERRRRTGQGAASAEIAQRH
ncbi:hypothetical protein QA646_17715 [Rhizobium sp. CB3090]|uniref:hypothetical protein n=1 Tax=Rhizobium sp. CB3090 TaxID=3039156 RepID=UPI0024B16418|nr:hypothetical protein [Rhizobium sp. CB3090]WFU09084.1 hypothetical protein QA646_17715 [Rhizobium sp. CB3090]